jgi:hypothetical protein
MSKNLQHYLQKERFILNKMSNSSALFVKTLKQFQEKNLNIFLSNKVELLYDYNKDYLTNPLKIKSFNIQCNYLTNSINACFKIDQNKKNIIRVNMDYKSESDRKVYDILRIDIKKIMNKKEIIFQVIKDFEFFLLKRIKLNKKIKKYQKLIILKKQEKTYLNFNNIFKKFEFINIHKHVDTYYENTDETKEYKSINYMEEEYRAEDVFLKEKIIKIFNYKKENEYYVFEGKLISKKQATKFLSNSLIYKNKSMTNIYDLPFTISLINTNCNNYYSCPYNTLSKFLLKQLLIKNINSF